MGREKCGSLGIFIEKDPFAWSEQVPVGDRLVGLIAPSFNITM